MDNRNRIYPFSIIWNLATVTWAHHGLIAGNRHVAIWGIFFTILLGIFFTFLQITEYLEAPYTIADSVFGASFFSITGLHGFHVIIGSLALLVCFIRILLYHFTRSHHIGLEASILYWHFVDYVWLFVFSILYVWIFGISFYSPALANSFNTITSASSLNLNYDQSPILNKRNYSTFYNKEEKVKWIWWDKNLGIWGSIKLGWNQGVNAEKFIQNQTLKDCRYTLFILRILEIIFIISLILLWFKITNLAIALSLMISSLLLLRYYIKYNINLWKNRHLFIVQNSPINTIASTFALLQHTPRNPIVKVCILCIGGIIGGDLMYNRLFPDRVTPLAAIGNQITDTFPNLEPHLTNKIDKD